ncbi:hypothetical protein G6F57_023639 [Rhizopus arrhizus]|nr:hypothetical protein G6F57_023639 [Rhizopus arrhizus]
MHYVGYSRQQLASQTASGVKASKVLRLKAPRRGEHNSKGVTHRDRRGGGTGGREVVVARFMRHRNIEGDVSISR